MFDIVFVVMVYLICFVLFIFCLLFVMMCLIVLFIVICVAVMGVSDVAFVKTLWYYFVIDCGSVFEFCM